MKYVPVVTAEGTQLPQLPVLARITLAVCFVMCSGVTLVSFLSIFFYAPFAQWLGQPFDGLVRLNPLLLRSLFLFGTLIYAMATLGCVMMWRRKRLGYRVFSIPAYFLFAASLFFVFSPLSILQLFILAATLLILSLYLKHMV